MISQKQSQLIEAGDLIDDEEFADTAKAEVDRLNEQISSDKKDLLLAMLPIDPDEGRNTIVEIRAKLAETKLRFSLEIYLECIVVMLRATVGRPSA